MWILLFTFATAAAICLSVAAILMRSVAVGRFFTRQVPQVPISRERPLLGHSRRQWQLHGQGPIF
jgi:hypothetical protein